VYFAGIISPSRKALDVTFNVIVSPLWPEETAGSSLFTQEQHTAKNPRRATVFFILILPEIPDILRSVNR
jgi:hypothetical protein